MKQVHDKGIFWLASYPKSGNTWTRSFITAINNYVARQNNAPTVSEHHDDELPLTEEGLIDINAIATGAIASSRGWVEEILGIDTNNLTDDEIDQMRPNAYRWFTEQLHSVSYKKIHDAYTFLDDGTPLIPSETMIGALCIVRNPFDVAISYANHASISIDESIECLCNPNYALSANNFALDTQVRQWLLSWSDHVLSWTNNNDFNRLAVRYEDMKQQPLDTFSKIARFLQLPHDKEIISNVLESIKIERLQAQEEKNGFSERAAKTARFFRKGIVGDWYETLSASQVQRIIDEHHVVMQKFGYLDDDRQPTQLIMPE